MENSEQNEVLFPSEEEIKSYFPDDVWNTMADYERKSYRNMLHNYNVMKSLDLKPIKPSFMTLYQKKASKRKATSNLCRVPTKKPLLTRQKSLKKEKETKGQQKTEHQKENRQKMDQQKTDQEKKAPVVFDNNHKWKSISLHCVFSAVFKVYKRYHGIIKGHNPRKRKTLKVSKKYLKKNVDKNMEEKGNNGVVNVGVNVEESSNEKTAAVATKDDAKESVEENKISTDVKVEECAKPCIKSAEPQTKPVCRSVQTMTAAVGCSPSTSAAAPHTKPVCRSVQTMTVAVGCSPSTTALVFVNAATSKKLSVSFPDPKPLTPQERKRMKKINQERMKNRRNVQTQTAAEGSAVEEAKLVFFPVLKSKKPKAKTATTQEDNEKKEELLKTETQQDGIGAEGPDGKQSDVGQLAPAENEEGAKPSGNDEKDKHNDTSPEDEFGFYALFKQENDAKAKNDSSNKPNIPETKPQPGDSDLAVPGCSGLSSGPLKSGSTGKRIKQRQASCTSTKSSDEDEFGFFQLAKDLNAKKDVASKPNIPKTKAQPKDTDLAVPGCSNQSPGRRYPRRALPVIDYTEGELLQDDEYLFCDLCDREYEGDCPEHGPHKYFPDRFVPVTGDGGRAVQTTPAMLKIDKSKIPGAGSGVWTMVGLPPHVRFGPYQGDETPEPDPLGYSWAIVKDKRVDHYIAGQSTATSNWMRFVNCARHETEQNLMAFQYKGQMYYRTVKLIPPKAELFVWYGKEYAEQLGISMESFRSKDTSHLRSLVFSCDKCNVTYTSPLYLEAHKKRCRGKRVVIVEPARVPTDVQTLAVVVDGRKTFCCNLCDYKTERSGNIRNHLITHSGAKPHGCRVCGKRFSLAGHLEAHKRIHTGVKPYKCDHCTYTCNHMSSLRWHMTRHTMEKMFACPQCEYKTAKSGDMNRHSRTHSGVKPYCCTLCSYRTIVSSALNRHMRTHTGEKPYSCPHCQYRAAWKGDLNKHIARKHTA